MKSPMAFFRRLERIPQGFVVVIAAFLPIFAIVSMFPALPAIISHFEGNPNARELVPLMVSAPGLAMAILAPFAGYFVDRFGRLPLLLWATFFYGIFGSAPFFMDSLTLMFVTRLLLGVCEAAILTVVMTLIGDYWEDEGRRDWLFLQGIAGPFLAAGVVLVAGPVAEFRWNAIFLVYLVAFVVFFAMKFALFEPRKSEQLASKMGANDTGTAPPVNPLNVPFPTRHVAMVGAFTLFTSLLYYVFIISGSLVFVEIGITEPSRISALSAGPSLFIMLGALVFRIASGLPTGIQLAIYLLLMCGGLLGMGLADGATVMVVSLIFQQTGAGMTVPTLIAWIQTRLPFEHRGRGMGIWTACFFFGQFSSPWLVARLEQLFGSTQSAFVTAGILGLSVAVVLLVFAALARKADS